MHTCVMSWLCANKTSFTDTEIWISYDFLVSGDSRLLFIFSNRLKIIKFILSSQATQKQVWAVVCHPWLREGSCKDLKTVSDRIYALMGP